MLEVNNLSLKIDQTQVFSNISLTATPGEVLLIRGKSGSGKSSLLQVIAGVIPNAYHGVVTGDLLLNSENIIHESMIERSGKIGYLMQDPDSQLTSETSFDELVFGPENFNKSKREIDEIVDYLKNEFNLNYILTQNTHSLSGGQKQRLMLASIVALNPEIYLLDEPTANLDTKAIRQVVSIIDKLAHELGKTVIFVEHNMLEFSDIIDSVYDFEEKTLTHNITKADLEKMGELYPLPNVEHSFKAESYIEVKDLSYAYNDCEPLFEDINFNIHKGEIVALVGENGAGKSSLANLLSGLIKYEKGKILIDGQNIKDLSNREIGQKIGLVFQNPEHQFVKLTVEDELLVSLNYQDLDDSDKKKLVDEYLNEFQLSNHRSANPFELSQGQKRKLSTAVMLIQGQSFLILDEPTYGQDPQNLQSLMKLLMEVSKRGVSILIITHDDELLKKCCHSIILLKKKKIGFRGSPREYFDRLEVFNDSL